MNGPRNGEIRYLLGAELAQHHRYDEAVLELSAAVALNPLLHTARFQLGLLDLTMAQLDHATAVLAPLENLEEDAALKHFKRGLEALAVDDLQEVVLAAAVIFAEAQRLFTQRRSHGKMPVEVERLQEIAVAITIADTAILSTAERSWPVNHLRSIFRKNGRAAPVVVSVPTQPL